MIRNLYLTGLAVVALLAATACASNAGILSEDAAYWYINGSQLDTVFNPTTDWLSQMTAAGPLRVRVQQTVYDAAQTLSMLQRNDDGDTNPGYLYAYTASNLNVGNSADPADWGITNFNANWTPTPLYVTTSRQTPTDWAVDTSTTKPAWQWTSAAEPGIMPGESVGGFWAVSNISVDGRLNANVVHVGPLGRETLTGKTAGPLVPDPPTFLSLAAGLMGLGLTRRLRRK
jgi:hypothetical protein